jgi:hypothetical protein
MVSGVGVEAAARLVRGVLQLKYEVRNESRRDLYLLNRLFDASRNLMSPDLIYVTFDAARRTVVAGKYLADFPAGPAPTSPVAPFVTPVRAGQTWGEMASIPVPLQRYVEYGPLPAPLLGSESVEMFTGIEVVLGLYWREPEVYEESATVFGQPVVIPRGYRGFPTFETLRSAVMPMAIPVVAQRQ